MTKVKNPLTIQLKIEEYSISIRALAEVLYKETIVPIK